VGTRSVKSLTSNDHDIPGLVVSTPSRTRVAFGTIESWQYELDDILSFDSISTYKIIEARITAHDEHPITLEVLPGTDLTNPLELNIVFPVKLSYVIHYLSGAGKIGNSQDSSVGQCLQIRLT
jgi:hypothetical protein